MYEIFRTNSFKKDYKKLSIQDKEIVKEVVTFLANGEELVQKKQKKGSGDSNKLLHRLKPTLQVINNNRVKKTTLLNKTK